MINFASSNLKLIVSSLMNSEAYTLGNGLDDAFILRNDGERMVKGRGTLKMITDSESPFKEILKYYDNTEKG